MKQLGIDKVTSNINPDNITGNTIAIANFLRMMQTAINITTFYIFGCGAHSTFFPMTYSCQIFRNQEVLYRRIILRVRKGTDFGSVVPT